jgi:ABC-type transport system involved in multi-copper enzyme maturation permease subunit
MQKIIRIELKKACCNKIMKFTFIIVMMLVLYHSISAICEYNKFCSYFAVDKYTTNPMITSQSLFCSWLGADVTSFPTGVFFFLLPLIAALPNGWSLVTEMNTGYTKNILSRISRRDYLRAKYIASFVSGFVIVSIPLITSIMLLALFVPALRMESIYPYGTIGQGCMWSELYYLHPLVYCALYVVLDGVYAGLFSVISVALSFLIKNRIAVLTGPFFIMLFADYIDANFLRNGEYSPIKFLQALPVANNCYGWAVCLIAVSIFVITLWVLEYKGKRYEAL